MEGKGYYLAIDIGAGNGTNIAVFRDTLKPEHENLYRAADYGKDFPAYAEGLLAHIEELLTGAHLDPRDVKSIGIACAGILGSDGRFQLVHNIRFLNGNSIKPILEKRFGVPVTIENDADAGGLAEWNVLRMELVYWVFGGGWGGSWIAADGLIKFPSYDWDGSDESLHFTNEPGYAIPLDKVTLKTLFNEVSSNYDRFEQIVIRELDPPSGIVTGPSGNPDTIRAELILSGPGRLRLFKTMVGDDDYYTRFLESDESRNLDDPAKAGRYIDKLSSMRVEAAVNTDRLYGKVLARATNIMLKQAYSDGMPRNLPICLGGKPSYALPYFGPSAQRALARFGILNYLRPSVIDERGSNANLVGAAVLADLAWKQG